MSDAESVAAGFSPSDEEPSAYKVTLPSFHGPLDLLLYLVKRNEVDVLDVPIATLADQFLAFLAAVREVDVELAGDFLVMAATLMRAFIDRSASIGNTCMVACRA